MPRLRMHHVRRAWMTAACAAVIAVPSLVLAQSSSHLSLADRVSRLEQQQGQGGGIGLVNQMQQLQTQVQQLQGQIEELQYRLDQFQAASRDQYVDVDSRLNRLEGNAPQVRGDATGAEVAGSDGDGTAAVPGSNDDLQGADPQADYDQAFAALREGNLAAAARQFNTFISAHPNDALTPNAYYWLGESYYGTQNYQVALQTFQNLLRRFPDDAKAADALLKVGYSQYELQDWDAARATLEQVRERYPDTRNAQLAEGRLRALGLQAGR